MAITIEVLEGSEGKVICQVRGTGPDAGQKVWIIVRVPCASKVTPAERNPTLPSDGSLSSCLEFTADGSRGKVCKVSVEVSDLANNVLLKKREKILSL
jgi:hypothetical protein